MGEADGSLSIGGMATLACIWEATAPKPGNVYRGADFDDVTYIDFVTAAVAIGRTIDAASDLGFGATLEQAVNNTVDAVGTNTNLGTLLLVVPLAMAKGDSVGELLAAASDAMRSTSPLDTRQMYFAINRAKPGGMGESSEADLAGEAPVCSAFDVMQLAADRDTIARELVTGFNEVACVADEIARSYATEPLGEAIVVAALALQARCPDSLIARKLGVDMAKEASARAGAVLAERDVSRENYLCARCDFDFWLRADGHRRNPGTTADVIAAALFVLLRTGRISLPVRYY